MTRVTPRQAVSELVDAVNAFEDSIIVGARELKLTKKLAIDVRQLISRLNDLVPAPEADK